MMPFEIASRTVAWGTVDQQVLEGLRAALGLARSGRLTDREDEDFGYRWEETASGSVLLNLWRHAETTWSFDVRYEGQPPPDELVDRYQAAFRDAFERAGLVINQEDRW